jgi:hypothetical protein
MHDDPSIKGQRMSNDSTTYRQWCLRRTQSKSNPQDLHNDTSASGIHRIVFVEFDMWLSEKRSPALSSRGAQWSSAPAMRGGLASTEERRIYQRAKKRRLFLSKKIFWEPFTYDISAARKRCDRFLSSNQNRALGASCLGLGHPTH